LQKLLLRKGCAAAAAAVDAGEVDVAEEVFDNVEQEQK
jgi:hypothetical protein